MKKIITISIASMLFFIYNASSQNFLFVPIWADDVNVRVEPNVNSKINGRLPTGYLVRVIKKSPKEEIIDNKKGRWVYIETSRLKTNSNETIKGWIFDYYLAYKENFKEIKNWYGIGHFYAGMGDVNLEYFLSKNGNFQVKARLYNNQELKCKQSSGIFNKSENYCLNSGQIYQYKNILCLKEKNGSEMFFYIEKDGSIKMSLY